ncbi:MAG: alpha/beta hydrolase [Pirellulaceae bacterium]|nr:alpha/beta hydrolase [Pirellulaceae bacterium]
MRDTTINEVSRAGRNDAFGRSALVALAVFLSMFSAAAAEPEDVWLLSTRGAPRCGVLENAADNIAHRKLLDGCRCGAADPADFQTDDQTPIVVYIHGNNTEADEAVFKGMYAYQTIRSAVGCRSFRFVIWSWPAGRVCRRHRDDVNLKAGYCDVDGYYLAVWLDRLPPAAKVSLIGHSFGPRIISNALELLAGGEVAGRRLPEDIAGNWREGKRNSFRAVFLAAAIDADWLAPQSRYGNALSLVEEVLISQNCCDRALRFYPRVHGCDWSEAMGYLGPTGIGNPSKVRVVDVSCTVGKPHNWRGYCSAANIFSQWSRFVFLDDE